MRKQIMGFVVTVSMLFDSLNVGFPIPLRAWLQNTKVSLPLWALLGLGVWILLGMDLSILAVLGKTRVISGLLMVFTQPCRYFKV